MLNLKIINQKFKVKSAVFEHFTLTPDEQFFECQCVVENSDEEKPCLARISAFTSSVAKQAPSRASNLKRHLQRCHPKVFETVNEKDCNTSTSCSSGLKNKGETGTLQSQISISKFFVGNKVTVTMTSETFKHLLIQMVVQNSVPLTFFTEPAFLGLNGEMAKKLGISLERESIRRLILEESKIKKIELRNSLKNRFIFIKKDACTRHRVNYFAINVRFVDENNKVLTRTLGIKDTQAHHTSSYLHGLVEDVLNEFEIKKDQILCIVTDNASNMLSITEKMNIDNEQYTQILNEVSLFENRPETEPLIEMENDDYLDEIIENTSVKFKIQHMRCAVHTLQLAIRDGLKCHDEAALIEKIRKVVSVARNPKIDAILKRRAKKGAVIDQVTRWGSTYLMIKRLIDTYPEIVRDVARCVTAMPSTQVSVERLFSALKIIKSDIRASIKEDLASAILFLRTMH